MEDFAVNGEDHNCISDLKPLSMQLRPLTKTTLPIPHTADKCAQPRVRHSAFLAAIEDIIVIVRGVSSIIASKVVEEIFLEEITHVCSEEAPTLTPVN